MGGGDPLALIRAIVEERLQNKPPRASYTWQLFEGPITNLVKKVGEEAVEVVIGALAEPTDSNAAGSQKNDIVWEISDLLYHLAVLMKRLEIPNQAIVQELWQRHQDTAI